MNFDPFSTACGVAVNNSYGTYGTLTRASLSVLTPAQVKALYTSGGKWNEMTALLKTSFEMKMCGVRRMAFADWLLSSTQTGMGNLINVRRMQRGDSLIEPFIMGKQSQPVNIDFWAVTGGWANSAYTEEVTGPLTAADKALTDRAGVAAAAGDRIIRVVSRYGVELDAGYFKRRDSLYILDVYNGAAGHGEWEVIAAREASDGTYCDILIKSRNTYSATAANPAPTGNAIVLVGINNVNDYESYCRNNANYNPTKHVPFWYQTRRRTRRVDQWYKEFFAKVIDDNVYLDQFYNLPMSERNRQDEEAWKRSFVNAFLFGRPISSNQTLTDWESLENITSVTGATIDPGTGAALIAKRANMIGVYEQMKACSCVNDLQNQALNIPELLMKVEEIRRVRQSQGRKVDSIDFHCNHDMRELVEIGFINYTKAKYGDILRVNIEPGKNDWGFEWTSFRVPGRPYNINFVQSETFDDISSAFAAEDSGSGALRARGNFLLCLDVGSGGTIYPAVLGSNRKKYTVGQLENLAKIDSTFACVMENPTFDQELTSETVTAIVECPKASLWIEGIGLTTPTTTATYPYTDLVQ